MRSDRGTIGMIYNLHRVKGISTIMGMEAFGLIQTCIKTVTTTAASSKAILLHHQSQDQPHLYHQVATISNSQLKFHHSSTHTLPL